MIHLSYCCDQRNIRIQHPRLPNRYWEKIIMVLYRWYTHTRKLVYVIGNDITEYYSIHSNSRITFNGYTIR